MIWLTDKVDLGCEGTVLMVYDTAYEVEFVDIDYGTIDVLTVNKSDVIKIN